MIPEAGQIALIIALCLGALQGTVPLIGAWRGERWAMNIAPSLAAGFFVFLSIAFACLVIVFLQDDFSVKVVAGNSNSLLPPIYKFSAVWGNHEGSLLLWVWILGAWSLAGGSGKPWSAAGGISTSAEYFGFDWCWIYCVFTVYV